MTTHVLKSWPGPFEAVRSGRKRFEYRRVDRVDLVYAVGDVLFLREWQPAKRDAPEIGGGDYTGRVTSCRVTYVLEAPSHGVPPGYCVLSIDRIWPHADGDAFEAQLAKAEALASEIRELSHPGAQPDALRRVVQALRLLRDFLPPEPGAPKRFEITDD